MGTDVGSSSPEAPRRVEAVHFFGDLASRIAREHADLLGDRTAVVLDPQSFATALEDMEVLVCHAPPGGHWERARRLRLIQMVGVGVDRVLPAPGLSPDVLIANASGLSSVAMAEYAVGMLLSLVKRLPCAAANQRARRWAVTEPGMVAGRTVAILGVGPVGRETARRLVPFDVRVLGVARRARPVEGFDEVHDVAALHRVLARSDDLVIALPLTSATAGIIGAKELDLLRPGANLVNVARGALVDEDALVAALRAGQLAGAGLDTVQHEPLPPESPLWDVPGLVLTAHVSWTTPGYPRQLMRLVADNVARVEEGRPVRNRVDPLLGYHVAG